MKILPQKNGSRVLYNPLPAPLGASPITCAPIIGVKTNAYWGYSLKMSTIGPLGPLLMKWWDHRYLLRYNITIIGAAQI